MCDIIEIHRPFWRMMMNRKVMTILVGCVAAVLLCVQVHAQDQPVQSVKDLIRMFETEQNLGSQTTAIGRLAHHEDPKGPRYLGGAFRRQKDIVLKFYIIEQLTDAGTDAAGEALLECYDEKDDRLRGAYRKAAVDFSKKPGFNRMVQVGLLKKKGAAYAGVRKLLAEILGNMEDKGAIALLKKALSDKDWEVRKMAAESLCEIGTDNAVREACRAIIDKRPDVALAVLDMLGDFDVGKFTEYIMRGLRVKDPTVRVRTLEVLAGQVDRRLVRSYVRLAKDQDARVRKAAIESLKWAQDRGAVGDLIKELRSAGKREKGYIAEALKVLTGQDFGTDFAGWDGWWSEHRKTAQITHPPQPRTSWKKATYFGTTVESKNVIFIIDISGSMSERYEKKGDKTKFTGTTVDPEKQEASRRTVAKIKVAKRELVRCIKKLERDVKFNIIFYNQAFTVWKRTKDGRKSRIIPATVRNKREAREFVVTFTPSGRTNIFDSLAFALNDKEADTIYLLSDGMPNEGRITGTDEIVVEICRINKTRKPRATIHTIGFGLRPEGNAFLKRLAKTNDGFFLDM